MSYSAYNLPVFSSSERLAALARFVSDTTQDNSNANTNDVNSDSLNNKQRATPIKNVLPLESHPFSHNLQMGPGINAVTTILHGTPQPVNISSDNTDEIVTGSDEKNTLIPSISPSVTPLDVLVPSTDKTLMFIVSSAGFHYGNFSEFKLDSRVFIPKISSKRGITVLYLINDLKRFHAWNFDFYKSPTKVKTNSNFISLLRKLPGDTYFAMSIKDDAHRNLFEGTKNFLARILGCTMIWKLKYRNSWCAIVYKKTEKSFEVVAEAYNPNGVAVAQYPIIDKTSNKLITPQTSQQTIVANSLWKPKPETFQIETKPALINNYNSIMSPPPSQTTLNTFSQTSSQTSSQTTSQTTLNTSSQTAPEIKESNTELIKKTDKLTEEVRELKQLVLEQSKLIKQLLEKSN